MGNNDVSCVCSNKPKKRKILLSEYNYEVMQNMIKQYGPKKGKQVYYATANKEDRNPENFKEN